MPSNSGGFGVWAKGKIAGHFESDGNPGAIAVEAVNTADWDAIVATSSSPNHAAVSATNNRGGYALWASSPNLGGQGGIGLYAKGATWAGQFDGPVFVMSALTVGTPGSAVRAMTTYGDVEVGGDVHVQKTLYAITDVVLGSDCAEDFDIIPLTEIEPGTVMTLTGNGVLEPSQHAYDKKVAGVISGAGDYRPGLILGRDRSSRQRMPLALVGKVYCKADAQYGAIDVGDLLTTSPTPGYAMRAVDPLKAFGAVIGKALRRLDAGQGLIPVLISLQ